MLFGEIQWAGRDSLSNWGDGSNMGSVGFPIFLRKLRGCVIRARERTAWPSRGMEGKGITVI